MLHFESNRGAGSTFKEGGAEEVPVDSIDNVCAGIYHKPEDYYKIPFMIKEMVPEYKLYVRHHTESRGDTVLYATL